MRSFYDPRQALHQPRVELHNGGFVPYREHGGRIDAILAVLGAYEQPPDIGMAPLEAIHAPEYLNFLRTAFDLWSEAGRPGDAIPYVWPVVGRRSLSLSRIDALLGRFSFDATTPITAKTWLAVYASAQTAVAATSAVLDGASAAFALSRPPGHHAGRDYLGGYCYLNFAAIAAQYARDAGAERVAILDIDYHHGNGTQDIFWDRGDVFYASIHADPATDYPFFWGHSDERGGGPGEGATLNLPLPQGTGIEMFRAAQAEALHAIAEFAPELLVVSFGADTFDGDPISHFRLRTPDYAVLAGDIAVRGWPTVVIMEGGYAVESLGENVAAFLGGFERRGARAG